MNTVNQQIQVAQKDITHTLQVAQTIVVQMISQAHCQVRMMAQAIVLLIKETQQEHKQQKNVA